MRAHACCLSAGAILLTWELCTQLFVLGRPAPKDATDSDTENPFEVMGSLHPESWNLPGPPQSASIAGLTSQETSEVVGRILHGELEPVIAQPMEISQLNHQSIFGEVSPSEVKPTFEMSPSGLVLDEGPQDQKVVIDGMPVIPSQSYQVHEQPDVLEALPEQGLSILRDPVIVPNPDYPGRVIESGYLQAPVAAVPIHLTLPKLTDSTLVNGELLQHQTAQTVLNHPIDAPEVVIDSPSITANTYEDEPLTRLSVFNKDPPSKKNGYSDINTNTYDAATSSTGFAQQNLYSETSSNPSEVEETEINNPSSAIIASPSPGPYYGLDTTKFIASKDTLGPIKDQVVTDSSEGFRNIDDDLLALSDAKASNPVLDARSCSSSSESLSGDDYDFWAQMRMLDDLSASRLEDLDDLKSSVSSSEEIDPGFNLSGDFSFGTKPDNKKKSPDSGNLDGNLGLIDQFGNVGTGFSSSIDPRNSPLQFSGIGRLDDTMKGTGDLGHIDVLDNMNSDFASNIDQDIQDSQSAKTDGVFSPESDLMQGLGTPNTNIDVDLTVFENDNREETLQEPNINDETERKESGYTSDNLGSFADSTLKPFGDTGEFSGLADESMLGHLKNAESYDTVSDNISRQSFGDTLGDKSKKNLETLEPISNVEQEDNAGKVANRRNVYNFDESSLFNIIEKVGVHADKSVKKQVEGLQDKAEINNDADESTISKKLQPLSTELESLGPIAFETQRSEEKITNSTSVEDFAGSDAEDMRLISSFPSVTTDESSVESFESEEENSKGNTESPSEHGPLDVQAVTVTPQDLDTPTTTSNEFRESFHPDFGSKEEQLHGQTDPGVLNDDALIQTIERIDRKASTNNSENVLGTPDAVHPDADPQQRDSQVPIVPETVYSLQQLNDEAEESATSLSNFRKEPQKRSVRGDILPGVEKLPPLGLEKSDAHSSKVKHQEEDYKKLPHDDTRISDVEPEVFKTDEPLSAEERPPVEYASRPNSSELKSNATLAELGSVAEVSGADKETNSKPNDLQAISADIPPPRANHSVEKKDDPLNTLLYQVVDLPIKEHQNSTRKKGVKPHNKSVPVSKSASSLENSSKTTKKLLISKDVVEDSLPSPSKGLGPKVVFSSDSTTTQATVRDKGRPIPPQTDEKTFKANSTNEGVKRRRRSVEDVDSTYDMSDLTSSEEEPSAQTIQSDPPSPFWKQPLREHPDYSERVPLATTSNPPRPVNLPSTTAGPLQPTQSPTVSKPTSTSPRPVHLPSTTAEPLQPTQSPTVSKPTHYHHPSTTPEPSVTQAPTTNQHAFPSTTFEPLPTPLPEASTTTASTTSTKTKKKKKVWKIPFYPNNIVISSNGSVREEPKKNFNSDSFPTPRPVLKGRFRSRIPKTDEDLVESARQRLSRRFQSRKPFTTLASDSALIEKNRLRRPEQTTFPLKSPKVPTLQTETRDTSFPLLPPLRPEANEDIVTYLTSSDPSKLPSVLYDSPAEREEARSRRLRTVVGLAGDVRSLMADRAKKAIGTFANIVGVKEGNNKEFS